MQATEDREADFDRFVDSSVLPLMLREARQAGLPLVLVVRACSSQKGQQGDWREWKGNAHAPGSLLQESHSTAWYRHKHGSHVIGSNRGFVYVGGCLTRARNNEKWRGFGR